MSAADFSSISLPTQMVHNGSLFTITAHIPAVVSPNSSSSDHYDDDDDMQRLSPQEQRLHTHRQLIQQNVIKTTTSNNNVSEHSAAVAQAVKSVIAATDGFTLLRLWELVEKVCCYKTRLDPIVFIVDRRAVKSMMLSSDEQQQQQQQAQSGNNGKRGKKLTAGEAAVASSSVATDAAASRRLAAPPLVASSPEAEIVGAVILTLATSTNEFLSHVDSFKSMRKQDLTSDLPRCEPHEVWVPFFVPSRYPAFQTAQLSCFVASHVIFAIRSCFAPLYGSHLNAVHVRSTNFREFNAAFVEQHGFVRHDVLDKTLTVQFPRIRGQQQAVAGAAAAAAAVGDDDDGSKRRRRVLVGGNNIDRSAGVADNNGAGAADLLRSASASVAPAAAASAANSSRSRSNTTKKSRLNDDDDGASSSSSSDDDDENDEGTNLSFHRYEEKKSKRTTRNTNSSKNNANDNEDSHMSAVSFASSNNSTTLARRLANQTAAEAAATFTRAAQSGRRDPTRLAYTMASKMPVSVSSGDDDDDSSSSSSESPDDQDRAAAVNRKGKKKKGATKMKKQKQQQEAEEPVKQKTTTISRFVQELPPLVANGTIKFRLAHDDDRKEWVSLIARASEYNFGGSEMSQRTFQSDLRLMAYVEEPVAAAAAAAASTSTDASAKSKKKTQRSSSNNSKSKKSSSPGGKRGKSGRKSIVTLLLDDSSSTSSSSSSSGDDDEDQEADQQRKLLPSIVDPLASTPEQEFEAFVALRDEDERQSLSATAAGATTTAKPAGKRSNSENSKNSAQATSTTKTPSFSSSSSSPFDRCGTDFLIEAGLTQRQRQDLRSSTKSDASFNESINTVNGTGGRFPRHRIIAITSMQRCGYVPYLFVEREFRKCGVGKVMLGIAAEWVRMRQLALLWWNAHPAIDKSCDWLVQPLPEWIPLRNSSNSSIHKNNAKFVQLLQRESNLRSLASASSAAAAATITPSAVSSSCSSSVGPIAPMSPFDCDPVAAAKGKMQQQQQLELLDSSRVLKLVSGVRLDVTAAALATHFGKMLPQQQQQPVANVASPAAVKRTTGVKTMKDLQQQQQHLVPAATSSSSAAATVTSNISSNSNNSSPRDSITKQLRVSFLRCRFSGRFALNDEREFYEMVEDPFLSKRRFDETDYNIDDGGPYDISVDCIDAELNSLRDTFGGVRNCHDAVKIAVPVGANASALEDFRAQEKRDKKNSNNKSSSTDHDDKAATRNYRQSFLQEMMDEGMRQQPPRFTLDIPRLQEQTRQQQLIQQQQLQQISNASKTSKAAAKKKKKLNANKSTRARRVKNDDDDDDDDSSSSENDEDNVLDSSSIVVKARTLALDDRHVLQVALKPLTNRNAVFYCNLGFRISAEMESQALYKEGKSGVKLRKTFSELDTGQYKVQMWRPLNLSAPQLPVPLGVLVPQLDFSGSGVLEEIFSASGAVNARDRRGRE